MKNLLQTVLFIIAFVIMNQFSNAQTADRAASQPPKTMVSCNCTRAGYGCFGSQSYCIMYCRHFCSTHRSAIDESVLVNEASFVEIYPNPASNSTTIYLLLEHSEKISVKIFDLNGRLVKTLADDKMKEGENEIDWNVADVNAGVYFVQFQSAELSTIERLIVAK